MSFAKAEVKVPKRVLVVATMNGAGEAVAPVVRKLREQGTKVLIVSQGGGVQAFKKFGIEPEVIPEKGISREDLLDIAREFNPTSVLAATSSYQSKEQPQTLEQMIYHVSKDLGIKCIAVLDYWGGYSERFSDQELEGRTDQHNITKIVRPLVHMPDVIAIMDEYAKEKMLAEGFDPKLLAVTGQPYFEYVAEVGRRMPPDIKQKIFSKAMFPVLGPKGEVITHMPFFANQDPEIKLIVFISDIVSTFYPKMGYDEYTVLQEFLYAANALPAHGYKVNVIVRPHPFRPGRDKEAFAEIAPHIGKIGRALHNPTKKEDQDYYTIEELLSAADLVVGTMNLPLFTAKCLGKPVISFQPNLQEEDRMAYTNERGLTTLVTDEREIVLTMMKLLSGRIVQEPMPLLDGATDRVIELLA